MIRLKLWFSQITIGSVIAFALAITTILAKEEAVALLVLIGMTPELAGSVQKFAVGALSLILLYARSPKQEPLFTTANQKDDMPKAQTEAVIVAKEEDRAAAKKD